jgi:hypothetical protein
VENGLQSALAQVGVEYVHARYDGPVITAVLFVALSPSLVGEAFVCEAVSRRVAGNGVFRDYAVARCEIDFFLGIRLDDEPWFETP